LSGPFSPTIGVRPGAAGPKGYTALIGSELARWRAVIAAGSITADRSLLRESKQ